MVGLLLLEGLWVDFTLYWYVVLILVNQLL